MRKAWFAVAVLALGLPGCAKSEKPTALAVTTAEPGPGKVQISAPDTVKAGLVEISLKNTGQKPHDALFVRIEGNHSAQELVDVVSSESAPPPDWARLRGGVTAASPGQTKTAQVVLPPGSYYLIDPGSDENNNSFAKAGAVRPLQVTGTASKAAMPKASAAITASDYSFSVPANLKAGTATFEFRNTGAQPHLLVAAPIPAGKTIEDVKAAFASNDPSGPPPLDFEKATGAQAIDGGASEVTTMTFEKGSYAFICFLNNRGGGPPHFTLGMLQAVTVS